MLKRVKLLSPVASCGAAAAAYGSLTSGSESVLFRSVYTVTVLDFLGERKS